MAQGMLLYDLTPLTGRKASADRTVVIMAYDVNYLLARIILLSLLPAMLLGAMTYPVLGSYAILVVLVVETACTVFFYARSSTGLQLRIWRHVWNRGRANLGKIHLRNVIVSSEPPAPVMLTQASVPNPSAIQITDADVFGATPAGAPAPPIPLKPAPERRTDCLSHDWYTAT